MNAEDHGSLAVVDGFDLVGLITERDLVRAAAAELDFATTPVSELMGADPDTFDLTEVELPDEDSRPRRLGITSDGNVWYVDYALGKLGRYSPSDGEFTEWPMPHGDDSRPYGMAVDKNDVIWAVETGVSPNRFVGFDSKTEEFVSSTEVPSGGGTIRHMDYYEPRGEVWFGADTNTIGRARVH